METTERPVQKIRVILKNPNKHPRQLEFIRSEKKRIILRCGRRAGKTTGFGIRAVERFMKGRRQLYAAPVSDQLERFWYEVTQALAEPLAAKIYHKNETEHSIELAHHIEYKACPSCRAEHLEPVRDHYHCLSCGYRWGEQKIRAKTAFNAETMRGDFADDLYLDEFQLMDETAWTEVGVPMLLDTNGTACFAYTPRSLHSRSMSKATDPQHAAKLFAKAQTDPRWLALHFTSHENPFLTKEALDEVTRDMTALAVRQEIMAEDLDEVPGAFWTRALLDKCRTTKHTILKRVVVGVDPPGGATECGIVACGIGPCFCKGSVETHGFVIEDRSLQGSPNEWAKEVLTCYYGTSADRVLGEKNYGGDLIESNLRTIDPSISYENVVATRGKAVRAEPVAALFEQGKVHLVGQFAALETELVTWSAESSWSPNRLDAMIWALSYLMLGQQSSMRDAFAVKGQSFGGGLMKEVI